MGWGRALLKAPQAQTARKVAGYASKAEHFFGKLLGHLIVGLAGNGTPGTPTRLARGRYTPTTFPTLVLFI